MRPAKILHLHSSYDLGGQEARAVRLMRHFGTEAEHTVVSAMPERMSARDAIDQRIKVSFPEDTPPLHGKPGLGRYAKLVRYFQRFDLLLSYNWGAMDAVMARTLFSKAMALPPLIHHEDGFNEDEFERLNWKRNWFRKLAFGSARAIVVPSLRLQEIATDIWKQPQAKVHRIPNGIAVQAFAKKPQRGAIPGFKPREGELVVGTVAGLRPVKNLPLLVRAVARAGDNLRLVIVGQGEEEATIRAEAERCGMADRLLLPGFLPNPERYVGLFDIFALSSDSEQFPIALLEAMAAGLPVVSTDVGDVVNMVAQLNETLVKPAGDEAALADAITALANNAELRVMLGEQNRMKAEAEYNEDKMLGRYAMLYGSAMRRRDFGRRK